MPDLSASGRRGLKTIRLAAAAGAALGIAGLGMMETAMSMPMPMFMGVERVVIACRMASGGASGGGTALHCPDLGEQARKALAEGLKARGRSVPPIVVVAPGDEAMADPAALVVTLHAVNAVSANGGEEAAVAVEIRRPGQLSDGVPFFQTPPAVASGAPGDVRAGIGRSLRASLTAGVVEPLAAAP